jgi:hypothetical protein
VFFIYASLGFLLRKLSPDMLEARNLVETIFNQEKKEEPVSAKI